MGDPVSITASADTLHRNVPVEDVACATLTFQNGAVASIVATTVAGQGFPHRLELYGTDGGIQIEGETVSKWEVGNKSPAVSVPQEGNVVSAGSAADPRGIALTGHTGIMRDFITAVTEDRSPMVDGEEGRRSLSTILGIYDAADIHG